MRSSRSRRRSHEDGDHEDSGEDQAHEVPADASDQSRHDEHFHGWLGPLQAASALAAHLAGCPLARTRGVEYQTFARRLLVSGPPNEQTLRIMTANRGHSVGRLSPGRRRTSDGDRTETRPSVPGLFDPVQPDSKKVRGGPVQPALMRGTEGGLRQRPKLA